jgi:hypothetical protein
MITCWGRFLGRHGATAVRRKLASFGATGSEDRLHQLFRDGTKDGTPSLAELVREGISQFLFQHGIQSFTHNWEHLGSDTILDMLLTKLSDLLGQKETVGAQHGKGRVKHSNKLDGMGDELGVGEEFAFDVGLDVVAKHGHGPGALLKETVREG